MKLEEVWALLPETIRLTARLIGLPATLRLVEALGGTTFPVSKNVTRLGEARHALLAEVVGAAAAETLTRHFGGDILYIPRCADALRHLRDRAIRAAFDAESRRIGSNAAVANLALKYKLTDRRIWEILKAPDALPDPARQPALF